MNQNTGPSVASLKAQLNAIMGITCQVCGHFGGTDTYVPNLSSVHNACRCPRCGSTNNGYNKVHSRLVSLQFKSVARKRNGL